MKISDLRDDGRADKTIQLPRLERLPDRAVQHIQHMLGALIRKRRTSTDDFSPLKKYSVHGACHVPDICRIPGKVPETRPSRPVRPIRTSS